MSNTKFWLIFTVLICLSQIGAAQSNHVSWSTIGWKSNWDFPIDVQISGQYRTKAGLENWDTYFGEVEMEYDMNKRWSVEIELRQNANNDTEGGIQGIENFSRARIKLKYGQKFDFGKLGMRAGYDQRFALRNNANESERLRLMLTYKYSIKNWKLDPEFFTEYFWDQLEKQSSSWRWGLSSSRKLSFGSLNLRFFLENDVISNNPTIFVSDIGLQIKLK